MAWAKSSQGESQMPPQTFDNCASKKGSKIRTTTKGPNKGRLICKPKKGHPVLGKKRGK
jgi:hypothetical protein